MVLAIEAWLRAHWAEVLSPRGRAKRAGLPLVPEKGWAGICLLLWRAGPRLVSFQREAVRMGLVILWGGAKRVARIGFCLRGGAKAGGMDPNWFLFWMLGCNRVPRCGQG